MDAAYSNRGIHRVWSERRKFLTHFDRLVQYQKDHPDHSLLCDQQYPDW